MNIVILGAGELGRELAWTLCDKQSNIVVVDTSAPRLERLRERLDVMTVQGDCASFRVLSEAGISKCDLLIAASGSDSSNVVACTIGRHFGVKKTICRVSSADFFSQSDDFPPSAAGVDHVIVPTRECVSKIIDSLEHQSLVEKLRFSHGNAAMCALRIAPSSPLADTKLRSFPDPALLSRIRFSLILRDGKLVSPSGTTTFRVGDEVYAAGHPEDLNVVLDKADPDHRPCSLAVVAGATRVGREVLRRLLEIGIKVRVIGADMQSAEKLLEDLPHNVMVIHGDPTESDVLEEAGAETCDVFISALGRDEDNILSGLLAKKMGARKVIIVTNKAEYVDIVPALRAIDCGFSPRLVAVNSVLYLLGTQTAHVQATLHRANAHVYEFEVQPGAPVCDRTIADSLVSAQVVLSAVFRNGEMIPATGSLQLRAGDRVAVVTPPQDIPAHGRLFSKKGLLSL